ncbi:MAG: AAA family ATPase [Motilibacteraceae bacterium]
MRLHSLEVAAFGPFAGTEHVGFDDLADAGLFLLHGPTGAGKTSILDAICYALYGVVPGPRQKAARLRSDHADPAEPTCVTLELTVRGRRLRVVRRPAWERPKRRGTGTTTEPAATRVDELVAGGWITRSTRNDEAAHLLRELVGMSAEQFCQVVLLPQGQFAEFLRAEPEERRPVLEALFDTRRFSAVEAWLAEQRRACARAVEAGEQQLEVLLARAAQAAGPLLAGPDAVLAAGQDVSVDLEASPEAGGALDPAARLGEAVARAAAAERACAEARERAEAAHEAASAQVDAARTLADLQSRHAQLVARTAAVEAAAPRRGELAARVDAARRAASVVPLVRSVDDARRSLARADGRTVHALSAVASLPGPDGVLGADLAAGLRAEQVIRLDGSPLPAADPAVADLRRSAACDVQLATLLGSTQDRLRARAAGLEALRAEETAALAAAAKAAALAERERRATESAEQLRARLQSSEPVRAAARTALAALTVQGADEPRLAAELERHLGLLRAARDRDRLVGEVGRARGELRRAVDAAQQARQDWLDLRQARLEGYAAELATALVAGACCPVCGSNAHPAPARGASSGVTAEDERRAGELHQALETERAVREAELAALEAKHAGAAGTAGGADAGELAEQVQRLEGELGTARRAAQALPAAQQQLERLEQAAQQLADQLAAGENDVLTAAAERAAAADRAAELAARVAAGLDGADDLGAALEAVATALAALDAAARALGERATAAGQLADVCDRALQAAAQARFPALADVVAAACPPAQLAALEQELDQLLAQARLVAELGTDPAMAEAAEQPAADVEGALARRGAARAGLERAAADLAAAASRHTALAGLHGEVMAALAALAPLRERHALVDGLSRLAEGTGSDNAKRMRLSAYVLAARLEQVAAAASERLVRMSAGRYVLVHTDEGSGRGRAGLGLRVVDAWTGLERDTRTLSGGEAFLASLALALGLADVVTAEAGGAAIETLFVDEGFGTLDEEALEEVLDVLDGLRSGGRVVGVVSHVADLRARIPAQVRVHKHRDGSTVTCLTA